MLGFISSDSQATLLALNTLELTSQLVARCVEGLNQLGQDNTVVLHWVKAHVGHELNDAADALAKTCAQ